MSVPVSGMGNEREAAMWWLVALAAVCACVAAGQDKRAELSPMPFVLGSRYGRSPPRHLAPRNDRFFMGSRYGKRGGPPSAPLPPRAAPAPAPAPGGTLLCDYSGGGVVPLYDCRPLRNNDLYNDRRSPDEPSVTEEE